MERRARAPRSTRCSMRATRCTLHPDGHENATPTPFGDRLPAGLTCRGQPRHLDHLRMECLRGARRGPDRGRGPLPPGEAPLASGPGRGRGPGGARPWVYGRRRRTASRARGARPWRPALALSAHDAGPGLTPVAVRGPQPHAAPADLEPEFSHLPDPAGAGWALRLPVAGRRVREREHLAGPCHRGGRCGPGRGDRAARPSPDRAREPGQPLRPAPRWRRCCCCTCRR